MSVIWTQINVLYAQAAAGGLEDLLATYGPFAPFAALLLWLLKLLWADNKEKEDEIRNLTDSAMEKVIPLVLEATATLASAVQALNDIKDREADTQQDTRQLNRLMEELLTSINELHSLLRTVKRQQDGMRNERPQE